MKLSMSNIAWSEECDAEIYDFMKINNFSGLEIAPTRLFPGDPYSDLEKARNYSVMILSDHSLEICSMQSILFGKTEKLFGSQDERNELINYSKKAIDFASAIKCPNLVFGSPKNRIIEDKSQFGIALDFFSELGCYAHSKNTVLAMEANPKIYGTNFINTTTENFDLVIKVNSPGFLVNLDFGTMIQNNETLDIIADKVNLINHIHVSEPYLAEIQKRKEHNELCRLLNDNKYDRFISIEMKNLNDVEIVKQTALYIRGVFNVD